MTDKQLKLIEYVAHKSQIEYDEIVEWVERWVVTISELMDGILWVNYKNNENNESV